MDELSNAKPNTINSVLRALDVLLHLANSSRPLGITEIAEELDVSKAVVYRILSSLRARGFAEIDPSTRRYHLGAGVVMLTERYLTGLDLREVCRSAMRELVDVTEETATLSVRHGFSRIYIDQITPERNVKMVVDIGRSYPLHAGASSKAFLAFLAPPEQEEYLASELKSVTPETITSPAGLRRELQKIRDQGYATSSGERAPGAASVAAPVFGTGSDLPVAVISVCGPAERFAKKAESIAMQLLEASRRVSDRLGHRAE